jgi:hypothetical protein
MVARADVPRAPDGSRSSLHLHGMPAAALASKLFVTSRSGWLNAAVFRPVLVRAVDWTLEPRAIAPAVLVPVFGLLGMFTPCARCVGQYVRHIEEEDELSAWLALERATLLPHGLFAQGTEVSLGQGKPETANGFNCVQAV